MDSWKAVDRYAPHASVLSALISSLPNGRCAKLTLEMDERAVEEVIASGLATADVDTICATDVLVNALLDPHHTWRLLLIDDYSLRKAVYVAYTLVAGRAGGIVKKAKIVKEILIAVDAKGDVPDRVTTDPRYWGTSAVIDYLTRAGVFSRFGWGYYRLSDPVLRFLLKAHSPLLKLK